MALLFCVQIVDVLLGVWSTSDPAAPSAALPADDRRGGGPASSAASAAAPSSSGVLTPPAADATVISDAALLASLPGTGTYGHNAAHSYRLRHKKRLKAEQLQHGPGNSGLASLARALAADAANPLPDPEPTAAEAASSSPAGPLFTVSRCSVPLSWRHALSAYLCVTYCR
jgi:hypothetical protein